MIRLLEDYIVDGQMRYEAHKMIYTPEGGQPIVLGGILAASMLCALLSVTDEGERREIVLDTPEGRNDFFRRYEKEMLADNGGLFTTEVQRLNEAYMELAGEEGALLRICRNDRLLDLALGLMVEYMERLVREQVEEQIYIAVPWTGPFAQWLFNAGYAETRRQHLLTINWTNAAEVYALAEEINEPKGTEDENQEPTFVFEGLSAEQVLNGYWKWLWETAQKDANQYPDAKVRLAEYKQLILDNEMDYDFLKPEMKDFTPEQLNLFRSWMGKWKEYVKMQIEPERPKQQKKEEEQLFFSDAVLKCPTEETEDRYAATREYIKERKRYDKEFAKFVKNASHAKLCRQLTLLFGWYVEPSTLRKSLLRSPKRKTKKYT